MRAAIYARTNTDILSTLPQIQLCREYIEENGGNVVAVYDDIGVAGNTISRDGLNLLIDESQNYKFDTLVISDISRISRDAVQVRNFIANLALFGIELVFLKK